MNSEERCTVFVDNCNEEYFRDVESSAGRLGDNYYMQLVNYIGKYKKTVGVVPTGNRINIDVNGSFDQWNDSGITAVYKDYQNDTFDRNSRGFGNTYYSDDSGRNDIVNAKVCEDDSNLYFYVDTAEPLSPSADPAWMTLFLNVSGKEGYDFCVNRTSPADGKTAVEAVGDDGYERIGEAEIRFEENQLMLRVPKKLLGLGKDAAFTFKWADNYMDSNVYSFYIKGDSAPYGRLNWIYGERRK